ncbi:hypothetical protein NA57DRAFT_77382 [Rhizodiscina lignyota]|uniref:Lipocalin-like domain-containing protein n=1 Tax=Rhizodiscina lignyota TaxID=1504668 RepID=A0A9P4IEM7_9PEZI|nr:hypothetical protein NA57DRAFT_77382 [Rhizodiscina lignyota]
MPQNVWPQAKDKLAGGWKCIKYEIFDGDGPDKKLIRKPHGDNPLGRTILTPGGFLSAHMAFPDRLKPTKSASDFQLCSDEEVAYIAKGFSMYCGQVELFKDPGSAEGEYWWETTVVIATDPNRIGGKQVRKLQYWEENGKQYMELRPQKDMVYDDGTRARAVLTWEKFE